MYILYSEIDIAILLALGASDKDLIPYHSLSPNNHLHAMYF